VWIATPSLYESFIHYTLPAFTGAPNHERSYDTVSLRERKGEIKKN
jgi:hypothetical protein